MESLWWSLLLLLLPFVASLRNGSRSERSCGEVMFWFGDSMIDTGNLEAAIPTIVEPYGMTYFGKPSARQSDGRLSIDFLAQALRFEKFIDPILKSIDVSYRNGANFAVSGATALNTTFFVPMYLLRQVDNFVSFKKSVYDSKSRGHLCLEVPDSTKLPNALYAIFIGSNDIVGAITINNFTFSEVGANVVPAAVKAISQAIQVLYATGARKFLVYNVFPYGCIPLVLTYYKNTLMTKDSRGCLVDVNKVSELHGRQLFAEIEQLRRNLSGSQILYVDAFNFTLEALDNPAKYGFKDKNKLRACCGAGEPYNFNRSMLCGQFDLPSLQPSQFLSWDGVHFTEAYYRQLTQALLTGKFIDPPSNFFKNCDLDFSKF